MNEKIKNAINLLQSVVVDESSLNPEERESCCGYAKTSVGNGVVAIESVKSSNYDDHKKALFDIYNYVIKKEKQVSFDFLVKCVYELILAKSDDLYNELIKRFSETAVVDYLFIFPIYGFELRFNDTLEYGKFTFISREHISVYAKESCDNYPHCGIMI